MMIHFNAGTSNPLLAEISECMNFSVISLLYAYERNFYKSAIIVCERIYGRNAR